MSAAPTARVLAIDHVQLAMPNGREDEARRFFIGVLGFTEEDKPQPLVARGGLWLRSGAARLHLGVAEPFIPARKAHPAFLVDDLAAVRHALEAAGWTVTADVALPGVDRFTVDDPFGNRIELLQRLVAPSVAGEA